MLTYLRRHPFGVEAFFRRSLVLTYALPSSVLAPLIGPGLELDTYGTWGFLAIALVQTENLRPRYFPRWMGRDFFLSGYRIFTRFVRPGKPPLRGLRILRSDTDRPSMAVLGNLFTHYGYRRADVTVNADPTRLEVRVRTPQREADLHVLANLSGPPAPLPAGSPFSSMGDAQHFAGPLPYTFGYEAQHQRIVVVKGLRTTWKPRPVYVIVPEATYLEQPPFADAKPVLANAFYLENVPYRWKRGTTEALP